MSSVVHWKLFAVLWIASVVVNAAILPYILTLRVFNAAQLSAPLSSVIGLQMAQSGMAFGVVIFAGLFLGRHVGLGVPFLDEWLRGRALAGLRAMLQLSVSLGALAGLIILVLDRIAFASPPAATPVAQAVAPLWTRLLASFYGGISEEIGLRLGLMTLLVWIAWRIKAAPDGRPTGAGVWVAIVAVSIISGLGNLPTTAQLVPLTPLLAARAVALNGAAGMFFGWLY